MKIDPEMQEMIKVLFGKCKTDLQLTVYLQKQFSDLLHQHAIDSARDKNESNFALKYCIGYINLLDTESDTMFLDREKQVVKNLVDDVLK